jgi:hypothetical protein
VLTVEFTYRDNKGTNQTITRNINVAVSEAPAVIQPTLENLIAVNSEVFMGEAFDLNVDIFPGSERITGAVLSVRSGSVNFPQRFIGVIEVGTLLTDNTLRISGLSAAGNQTLTVTLTYTDSKGVSHSVSRSTTVRVLTAGEAEAGFLRIQNIMAPIKVEIDTHANMTFTLTNPTATAIKGAEAFLYDDNGSLLTSVYIRDAEAFSSETFALSFPIIGRTGTRSYRLSISYKNAVNTSRFSESSFVMTVANPGEMDGEDERPSSLRIQSIQAPAQMFTSVRTAIPFTVVNAGRGTAYNVEVYVVDEFGAEVAREYLGSISPAASREGTVSLRFNDPDSYNLTFYVIAENADESFIQVSRAFELRAVNYRVNITDVSGHEWIWNNFTTIEFGVINGGTEQMLNTNAQLTDANGQVFGEVYIGTIQPGEKKERQRFRDIFIWDDGMGFMELFIQLTYENAEMQEFTFTHSMSANFQSDMGWHDPWPDDSWNDPWEFEEDEESSIWLIIAIVGGSVIVAGIITAIIIIKVKKKKRSEDDDIDYFLSQMKMEAVPSSGSSAQIEAEPQKEEITQ